ncbi:MAG: hypothetical protein ACREP1_09430, partial [Rhodanobacteraceae bacterium]
MKWNGRTRCALVCLGFTLLFSVFSFRLVYLQMVEHKYYSALAAEKNTVKQTIYAERGAIYDTNNEILAQNVPVETVVADDSLINDREALVPLLADALQLPPNEVAEKIDGDRRYVVLKRAFPEEEAVSLGKRLHAEKLRGIRFERDLVRLYPNGPMLCHVIGFSDFNHHGIQGVEASMDPYLRGQNGFRYIERDRTGREIVLYRGAERAPRNGYNVHLTIDLNLQTIVENELDDAMKKY